MTHISAKDQRCYVEGHASAEPANIYEPDGVASPGLCRVRQQESPGIGAETDAATLTD